MREQQRGILQRMLLCDVRIVNLSLTWTMIGEAGRLPQPDSLYGKKRGIVKRPALYAMI